MASFGLKSSLAFHRSLAHRLKPWREGLLTCIFKPSKFVSNKYSSVDEFVNKQINKKTLMLESTSYNEFEDELFKTLSEGGNTFPLSRFLHGIKNVGVSINDPRLSKLINKINKLKKDSKRDDVDIDLNQMKELINENRVLTRQLFINNLIIPNFSEFCTKLDDMYWECRKNFSGTVSSNSKVLSGKGAEKWGVSLCTIDGQRHNVGDTEDPVIIDSCCRPINYALAVNHIGEEIVSQYISNGAIVQNDDIDKILSLSKMSLDQNPVDNSGSLLITSLLKLGLNITDQGLHSVFKEYELLSGGLDEIDWNKMFHRHVMGANIEVHAQAHHLRKHLCFPNGTDIQETIDFFLRLHSIQLSPRSMAVIAGTLANDGVCPITGKRVLSSSSVQSTISIMLSCGMSKDFSFKIGIPASSGVSGGVLLVVPSLFGAFLWSPLLNDEDVSIRALQFSQMMSDMFDLHYFSSKQRNHINPGYPGKTKNQDKESRTVQAIYSASVGDLAALRALKIRGHNMNGMDYDGRAPLHLAASQGELEVVKFLITKCKVQIDVKDRWGVTPLDNAIEGNKPEVTDYLKNSLAEAK